MAPKIKNELVDELLKDADPKKVFSSEGLLTDIKKALAERMLNAEMDQHLEGETAIPGSEGDSSRQPPQRLQQEDGPDGHQPGGAGDPAGSARHLRAAADREVPTPLPWL